MRLDRLRLHAFGPFTDAELDLSTVEPGLVAVVGTNGQGKTSLLNAFPGALGLSVPDQRQSLQDRAVARDALVEATVVNGSRYTIRHLIDAVKGTGEVLVLDAAGQPALPGTGRKAFAAWAARHMPSPEVFFSSVFAAQGSGGFAALGKSERKATILRLLGVEKLEQLAAAARERGRDGKTSAGGVRDRLRAAEEALWLAQGLVDNEFEGAASDLAEAVQALAAAEDDLRAAERAVGERRLAEEQASAIARADARVDELQRRLADIETRVTNNVRLVGDRDRVGAARVRADQLDVELIQRARLHLESCTESRDRAREGTRDAQVALQRAEGERGRLAKLLGEAEAVVREGPGVRRAVEELRGINLEAMEAALVSARADLEATMGAQLVGADGRIAGLRCALTDIVAEEHMAGRAAQAALTNDEVAARLAQEHPKKLASARSVVEKASTAITEARRRHTELSATSARLPQVEQAELDAADLFEREAAARAEVARLVDVAHARTEDERRAQQSLEQATTTLKAHEAERAQLEPLLRLEQPLAAASARVVELREQALQVEDELARAKGERNGMLDPVWPTCMHTVTEAEARLGVRKAAHSTALLRVHTTTKAKDALPELTKRVEAARAELSAADEDVADWQLIADGLGRDGVQALLVDAAGPELSTLANDLLHTAFGPRFSVRFETTRVSADGKKLVEDCDVSVMDTERGREGSLDTFSGGEKVILSEAVALALTTINCRAHGLTDVTIVRDESGAALDGANAVRFMQMLRRARELASCRHLLFVSHNPATWELADTRVEVGGGRVVVR